MKIYHNVSAQQVSWVKSNKQQLEANKQIANLYYPESREEFVSLIKKLYAECQPFDIIGYSSNTLFLPSYKTEHLICTKDINSWHEEGGYIICDCGVNISQLSKIMVEKGYIGFEGLTDLPGTVAAGVYGNCGCRGCSVNEIADFITLLTPKGEIQKLNVTNLNLQYRSSSLKRGDIKGIIIDVYFKIRQGDAQELKQKSKANHLIRLKEQPSAANNLGTTFIGSKLTMRGLIYRQLEKLVKLVYRTEDSRKSFPIVLKLTCNKEFIPYVYYWNRYMFLTEESHPLFFKYYDFVKGLFRDARLEIEIRY